MSVRLRGTDSVINIRWIPKYTGLERTLHWVHTACFLPLAIIMVPALILAVTKLPGSTKK